MQTEERINSTLGGACVCSLTNGPRAISLSRFSRVVASVMTTPHTDSIKLSQQLPARLAAPWCRGGRLIPLRRPSNSGVTLDAHKAA